LRKRFSVESIKRVEKAYARFGFLAIAVPAIFAAAVTFQGFCRHCWNTRISAMEVFIDRDGGTFVLRYYVEGVLAVFYGRRVLLFFKDNGVVIISIVATLGLIGFLIYMFINRRKNGQQLSHSTDNDSSD
jgi:hypothetical protein